MKPAGRERDIVIKKMKSELFYDGGGWWSVRRGEQLIQGRLQELTGWIKKWSTDRNSAWELWDELPVNKTFAEYKEGFMVSFVGHDRIFKGKDFADCVSQAWITWKESTR